LSGRHNAAEIALWQQLRAGQQGAWFRRQVVLLGSCIVDFYAPAAKLVVEVDGPYHTTPARRRVDARRDRKLGKAGFRVLRIAASLVLGQPAEARELVIKAPAEGAR
jgi:very-short-patch-repair endonuclease